MYALKTMLRIHFMQQWFGYSDPAMEEALYEVTSIRQFAGLSLSRGSLPDETTILHFRHLLEKHALAAVTGSCTLDADRSPHGDPSDMQGRKPATN